MPPHAAWITARREIHLAFETRVNLMVRLPERSIMFAPESIVAGAGHPTVLVENINLQRTAGTVTLVALSRSLALPWIVPPIGLAALISVPLSFVISQVAALDWPMSTLNGHNGHSKAQMRFPSMEPLRR